MKLRKSPVKPVTHLMLFSERLPIYASSCMTISGERTEQLNIFCRVTGFMSDFLSFIEWNLFGSFTELFNYPNVAKIVQDPHPGYLRMDLGLMFFPLAFPLSLTLD